MKKKKASPSSPKASPAMIALRIYGIWSREDSRVVFVSLSQEETEMEFDMEGYDEAQYALVCLDTYYDLSNSGLSAS